MKPKRIAIDFDGVLIDGQHIPRKIEIATGVPKPDAVEAVHFLVGLGFECYVLTSRASHEWPEVKEWLRKYGFPDMEVTNLKMNAVAYIDDRGIRFTNWQDICRHFG
jgi:hypothetical protein